MPLSHWARGSACRRLGSHDCLAQCALPLGDGNIRNAVRATETSAMQSGYPPPSSKRAGAQTECSPCPFRKKGDARTALRRSRSPGLHCGCFGRPPTNRIVPQSSWALPECLTGQHFSILLLLFCDNLTPPKSQRQSALRQAVVGAQTVATSTTAWRNGGLRGGQRKSVIRIEVARSQSLRSESAVGEPRAVAGRSPRRLWWREVVAEQQ